MPRIFLSEGVIMKVLVAEDVFWIKARANFTWRESELFDLRNRGATIEECAAQMNVSTRTINRINKNIKAKMAKCGV